MDIKFVLLVLQVNIAFVILKIKHIEAETTGDILKFWMNTCWLKFVSKGPIL